MNSLSFMTSVRRYRDFAEADNPYLDYATIGTKYYAERGGTFTAYGYA